MSRIRSAYQTLQMAAIVLTATPALAGSPFVTADPDSPDKGHYEINLSMQSTHISGETSGLIPSLEVNYGLTNHFEVHIGLPIAFSQISGGSTNVGISDVEFGVKYRAIDADNFRWRPAVAFGPIISLRTGDNSRGLCTGSTHGFLPIWISKDIGRQTVFGGGYNINPGPDNKDCWFAGFGAIYEIVTDNEITPELTMGTEIFCTTASIVSGTNGTRFDENAIYNISDLRHIMVSVGCGIDTKVNNRFSALIAYQNRF